MKPSLSVNTFDLRNLTKIEGDEYFSFNEVTEKIGEYDRSDIIQIIHYTHSVKDPSIIYSQYTVYEGTIENSPDYIGG